MRAVEDGLGKSLRLIHAKESESAGFAGGFDGDIANTEHALCHALIDAHVLDFVELNGARGFGGEPGFVAEAVTRDDGFGRGAAHPPHKGPQQDQRRQRHHPASRGCIDVGDDFERQEYDGRRDRADSDELGRGPNCDLFHRSALYRVLTKRARFPIRAVGVNSCR